MTNRIPPLALAALVSGLTPALAEEITFRDSYDREITLEGPATRMAVIPIPMASTVISIDKGVQSLVGVNPSASAAISQGILGTMFPDAKDIPSTVASRDFIPNIEELARVNPDLVIQWGAHGQELITPLTNAGLNVMLLDSGPEAVFRQNYTLIATARGVPERAADHLAWREAVQSAMAEKLAGIPEADRPRVVHISNGLDKFAVSGAGVGEDTNLVTAGGRNVAAETGKSSYNTVSKEQVAAWDPEVIFLNSFEPELSVSMVYDDPILSLTAAAQAGRVYKLPLGGYRWDPPNQESPLAWMWMANLIHPDLFSYDLRAEMKAAYATLYDHELTEDEMDEILRIEMQGNAPGYQVFARN